MSEEKKSGRTLEAIVYKRGSLRLLDQTKLPREFVYEDVTSCDQCFDAIRTMRVRGAPAIAVAAALSIAVEAANSAVPRDAEWVRDRTAFLEKSRPTAVNLRNACADLRRAAESERGIDAVVELAEAMLKKDGEDNRALSDHGCGHISKLIPATAERGKLRICTMCNAGALATARYGTALGVARSLAAAGRLERVYTPETRPWNQGARLSSFEMAYEGIPVTLLVDSAVASLMRSGAVDAVVVGADRVCANGDVANKIGTYSVALAAKAHGVPFFVAAPLTTFDAHAKDGSAVPIEQRPAREITHFPGEAAPHVADGVDVWNPSFDVTPAALISGIFTEAGVITPPYDNIPAFLKAHGINQ